EPQTESLQTKTPPTVSHELQTEAHIEQILPSPFTYQRKQRKTQKHRRAKKVTELPQTSVPLDHRADEAVHKEGGDRNRYRWQSQAPRNHGGALAQTRSKRVLEKPNEPPLTEGHTFGSGEGSMEHTFELMDTIPPTPHDLPLLGGNTPGSDEGRIELIQELMESCTSLTKRVLALEEAKTAQDRVITRLKLRVKRLEKKRKARTPQHMKRRLFKGRVESFDDDLDEEDASKQGRESDKTKSMFQDSDFDVLDDDMEDVEGETAHTATIGVSVVSALVTTAGTLIKMKEEKARAKGFAIKDIKDSSRPIRSITTLQPLPTIDPKDKGKGVLVEEEPEKPEKVKRRDQGLAQIESDAELAQRLHEEELAELDRAQKEKQKQEEATNAALAEEFDEIQARMDVDHELAVRLTHEEQEKYTIEERATLLAEYFERRKKQLAAERAEEIRNKPPTRAQKWINDFKPMDSEEDGINTKKAGKRIKRIADSTSKQKSPKKSKVIKEQESAESNEEAAADYEQEKEEQDLMDLHRSVMKRFEDNTLEGYNLLLWGILSSLIADGWKLEAEAESTMEFKLLKFIKRGLLGIMDFYNLVLLIQLDTAGDG
ncbi:hypothetical protein Tco_1414754, partial [Tanacetum coccineum]